MTRTTFLRSPRSKRGSVLFIVIVLITFITTLILKENIRLSSKITFIEMEFLKLRAYINCLNGVNFSINRYLTSHTRNQVELLEGVNKKFDPRFFLDGSTIELPMDKLEGKTGTIFLQFQDYSGLLNFSKNPGILLMRFIESIAVDERKTGKTSIIIDSILDWQDEDEFPRPNGAESEFYLRAGGFGPANRLISSPEELLLIRGIDQDIYRKAAHLIDFSADYRGLNPNTIPKELLRIFDGLSERTINELINQRRQQPFRNIADLKTRVKYNFSPFGNIFRFIQSNCTYITVKAEMAPGKFYFIKLKFRKKEGRPDIKVVKGKQILQPIDFEKEISAHHILEKYFAVENWEEGVEDSAGNR